MKSVYRFRLWSSKSFERLLRLALLGAVLVTVCFSFAGSYFHFDNLFAFLLPVTWGSLVLWILCAFRARRRRWDLLVASVVLVANMFWLWPSISFLGVAPKSLMTGELRLALSNVQTSNRNYGKLLAWVSEFKPDILVLIETDQQWVEGIASLEASYPHSMKDPQDHSNFGLSVYSRFPILQRELRGFSAEEIHSLNILVETPSGPVRVLATHALPPVDAKWFADRNKHLKTLAHWASGVSEPLIIAGDMNITRWSPHYLSAFSGDFENARAGFGVLPTWPSGFPSRMRTPIDQVILRGGLAVRSVRVGPDLESDHLPMEVVLGFVSSPAEVSK